jgi:hypothetical protein
MGYSVPGAELVSMPGQFLDNAQTEDLFAFSVIENMQADQA